MDGIRILWGCGRPSSLVMKPAWPHSCVEKKEPGYSTLLFFAFFSSSNSFASGPCFPEPVELLGNGHVRVFSPSVSGSVSKSWHLHDGGFACWICRKLLNVWRCYCGFKRSANIINKHWDAGVKNLWLDIYFGVTMTWSQSKLNWRTLVVVDHIVVLNSPVVVLVFASFAFLVFKKRFVAGKRDACDVGVYRCNNLLRIVTRPIVVVEELPLIEIRVLFVSKNYTVLLRLEFAFIWTSLAIFGKSATWIR